MNGSASINVNSIHPRIVFAYIKHLYESGAKKESFDRLRAFISTLKRDDAKLLARCHLTLGQWENELNDILSESTIPHILASFKAATEYDHTWYKAWHAWALSNFEVITHYQKVSGSGIVSSYNTIPININNFNPSNSTSSSNTNNSNNTSTSNSRDKITPHLVPAIHGFFRSIALAAPGNSLQDILRLLTLWFKYGDRKPVEEALIAGFNTINIEIWLQVIPQLIARIHSPVPSISKMTLELLTNVGKQHPQALVYPLSVASKSHSLSRAQAANIILNKLRKKYDSLVEAALVVSQELIRVSILWHEMWHEGLEEAAKLFFGNHDVEGMLRRMQPLHEMLEKGPETIREISFQQAYGRDLQYAQDWCKKYILSGNSANLNQAWELYYQVWKRLDKQLPLMMTLELQYVSPKLLAARDLVLAVPGTYEANQSSGQQPSASNSEVVQIRSFAPSLTVFSSKQRPRKLTIFGSDGKEYAFLLKGHEDLRQDQRVMQLFGLINTLLANDRETANRHLNIQRYAIIPLSPNSGLIGWVPNHDTLHALVKDYRESHGIPLSNENRLLNELAPDYESWTLIQRVELFEQIMQQTSGDDLARMLWLRSPNSEVWVERRTNYTRSLAVMSMVGYILGLGDRHPSNLMLNRITGGVTHIDFGDCFEVAMHREKYPERFPFRLTRMLINAMEVCGIEGNFRITCEGVMRVLRQNRESVMAVLEAFVHDPLINWRLLQPKPPSSEVSEQPHDKIRRDSATENKLEGDDKDDESETGVSLDSVESPGHRKQVEMSSTLSARSTFVDRDMDAELPTDAEEVTNERALKVVERISAKLRGKDFSKETLNVQEQVNRLIAQATSIENLCQCWAGWCPFW
jgi:FKBP12-rapamycin complex-associated protein